MVEVGFPPGVVNIVPGYGHTAGERLAAHPDVRKIAFTGSTATGRRIVEASAGNLKRVQLELGGKGANIVFDDANLTAAVNGSAFAIFHNQGQACIAGSRLILHESIADEFLDRFLALARSIRLGNPLDPTTEMGPLTSPLHRDRVLSYVKVAVDEGGEILTRRQGARRSGAGQGLLRRAHGRAGRSSSAGLPGGGVRPLRHGHARSPTTTRRWPSPTAPTTASAVGCGPATSRGRTAWRAALRSGMVWVNSYKRVNPGSPFGGTGLSGYGREMGFEAMREYTEAKSVWVNVDAQLPPWYPR